MTDAVTACILIIGNEILSGRTQDVNVSHLAKTLGGWGIQVKHCRVIPDVEDIIIDTVNEVRAQPTTIYSPPVVLAQPTTILLPNASPKPSVWNLLRTLTSLRALAVGPHQTM